MFLVLDATVATMVDFGFSQYGCGTGFPVTQMAGQVLCTAWWCDRNPITCTGLLQFREIELHDHERRRLAYYVGAMHKMKSLR
ncbi:hypothetical protein O9929_13645 [Vibrio lentus]|nr:hypothetical protein [Vibrio lentus]